MPRTNSRQFPKGRGVQNTSVLPSTACGKARIWPRDPFALPKLTEPFCEVLLQNITDGSFLPKSCSVVFYNPALKQPAGVATATAAAKKGWETKARWVLRRQGLAVTKLCRVSPARVQGYRSPRAQLRRLVSRFIRVQREKLRKTALSACISSCFPSPF